MPQAFDACRAAGGRIRTKELGGGKYIHICFHKGKSYPGYVKKKASTSNKYTKALANAK